MVKSDLANALRLVISYRLASFLFSKTLFSSFLLRAGSFCENNADWSSAMITSLTLWLQSFFK